MVSLVQGSIMFNSFGWSMVDLGCPKGHVTGVHLPNLVPGVPNQLQKILTKFFWFRKTFWGLILNPTGPSGVMGYRDLQGFTLYFHK